MRYCSWDKAPLQGWEPKSKPGPKGRRRSRTLGRCPLWVRGSLAKQLGLAPKAGQGDRPRGGTSLWASQSQQLVWDRLGSAGRLVVVLCPVPFCPPSPLTLPRVIGTSETPIIIVGNKRDLQRGRVIPRWNVSNLVKKTWKCGYIECSAKYNWHILLLFSELLKSVGCARCKHVHTTIRFQGALRRNRCTIM